MIKNHLQRKVGEFVSKIDLLIRQDQSVGEVLSIIRQEAAQDKIFYFYVIDAAHRLQGVVSTRNLLLSPSTTPISSIMEDRVISILADQTLQEAMETLSNYRLLAIPVVDREGKLLGTIDIQLYIEEAIDLAKGRRATSDLFQMLGITIEEGKRSPWQIYKMRMPWLFCNMIGGIACAIISRVFSLVLSKVLLLAFFIPLVLTLSESVSMQSMSYSLQLLHRPRITNRRIFYQILLDSKIVIWLALSCGIAVGAISLFWGNGIDPALAILAGIVISVACSGAIGTGIPLLLHAKKLDPKVAAGPIVLTLADIITTTLYLSLSTAWLL
jgi:magnesium transporter